MRATPLILLLVLGILFAGCQEKPAATITTTIPTTTTPTSEVGGNKTTNIQDIQEISKELEEINELLKELESLENITFEINSS